MGELSREFLNETHLFHRAVARKLSFSLSCARGVPVFARVNARFSTTWLSLGLSTTKICVDTMVVPRYYPRAGDCFIRRYPRAGVGLWLRQLMMDAHGFLSPHTVLAACPQ
jgi:hypothetical protein